MSLNKVILIGRLGRDPEIRYTNTNQAIAAFSIATEEKWKSANGAKQSHTEWHSITLFGNLAEIAAKYLKKGSQIYISGKIRSEKYTGKDGIERTAYKILGDELKMLGDNPQPATAPTPTPAKPQTAPTIPDDDIPY